MAAVVLVVATAWRLPANGVGGAGVQSSTVRRARFTPSSVILRETFFGKNLSRARNFVARLDAATATARSRRLHGRTQHTVASATI